MATDCTSSHQDFKPSIESEKRTYQGKNKTIKGHMTPTSKTPKNMVIRNPPTKIAQNAYGKSLASIDQLSASMLQLDLKEQKIMNNGAFGTSTKMRGGSLNKSSKI